MRVSLELRTLPTFDFVFVFLFSCKVLKTVRSVRRGKKARCRNQIDSQKKVDWRGIQHTFMNLERGIIVFAFWPLLGNFVV